MTRVRILALVRRASLRSRVLLIAVALLATGFTAFSLVTGNALRGYMENRLDAQLRVSAQVFSLIPPTAAEGGAVRSLPNALTDIGTDALGNPVITYLAADGTVEGSVDSLSGTPRSSRAQGPALPELTTAEVTARGAHPFTVDSAKGDGRWRVIAVPRATSAGLPGATATASASGSVLVATSMAQVDSTVGRMWRIYQGTGLGLLALLAVACWFAVRSGLRPLTRVEQTAAQIAGGDLSHRIPELAGPNTELGRLTGALNTMLGQLETAFAARAASEARMSRFVADASHELRTPLAGIKGLTDLHRMGALTAEGDIDATLSRIARESERLTGLVEDMLLLARLDEDARTGAGQTADSGRTQSPPALDLAPADLRTLGADALHCVRALDPARPVTLTGPAGHGPAGFAPTLADESRLQQVVTNLVGNAVTHTPPGTPIRVGVGTVGDRAVLEVEDQGPGLSPEQTGKVFERFYRADTSRTRATGGAGLGLAIAHSLVSAHGGTIEVASPPGGGATFRVCLPLLVEGHRSPQTPQAGVRVDGGQAAGRTRPDS